MLTYYFPEDTKIDKYHYLYNCIKDDILSGNIKPLEKLPSKRQLAKHLNVSIITIENTYSLLLTEGYIFSIEKRGYFVNQINVITKNKVTIKKDELVKKTANQYTINLATNQIPGSMFPYNAFAKITRSILLDHPIEITSRSGNTGIFSLRKAIADHLNSNLGVTISPNQIIIGSGSENLYNLIVQLFPRNYSYAIEDPGYKTISNIYKLNQVNYNYIPITEMGINVKMLEKTDSKIVHLSPNHHFPTGICMPISARLDLLNWANDNDGYIIEDDYDSEFRLKGKMITPLFKLDKSERTIYMNTFSKTISPSFRIGYMVLPEELMKQFNENLSFYNCSVSVLDQLIIERFISSGMFASHINKMRNTYKKVKMELLEKLNKSSIIDNITIIEPDSGLHFLIRHFYDIDDKSLVAKANSLSLNIGCISEYYQNSFDSHTILINFSTLESNDIDKAISLLEELFKNEKTFTN